MQMQMHFDAAGAGALVTCAAFRPASD